MKIAVLGYSGSGKSTLAGQLGEMLGLPVLHLDKVQFTPGWQERDRAEARALVAAFLQRPAWVIDGNYASFSLRERLQHADRIVFLRFSRAACLWRVLRRHRRYKGQARPDMAEGCPEKLDAEFLWWVLHKGRNAGKRRQFADVLQPHLAKTTVLHNQKQLDRFVRACAADADAAARAGTEPSAAP